MDGLDMDYGDYDLTMEDQEMLMVSTDILNLEDTAVDCLEETDMDGANQYLEFEDQGTMSDNGEQEVTTLTVPLTLSHDACTHTV